MIINSVTNTNFQRRTLVSSNNNNNLKGNISSPESNNASPAKLPPPYTALVCTPRFASRSFWPSMISPSCVRSYGNHPLTTDSLAFEMFLKSVQTDEDVFLAHESLPKEDVEEAKSKVQDLLKMIKNSGESFLKEGKRPFLALTKRLDKGLVFYEKNRLLFLNSSKIEKATAQDIFQKLKKHNFLASSENSNTRVDTNLLTVPQGEPSSPSQLSKRKRSFETMEEDSRKRIKTGESIEDEEAKLALNDELSRAIISGDSAKVELLSRPTGNTEQKSNQEAVAPGIVRCPTLEKAKKYCDFAKDELSKVNASGDEELIKRWDDEVTKALSDIEFYRRTTEVKLLQ